MIFKYASAYCFQHAGAACGAQTESVMVKVHYTYTMALSVPLDTPYHELKEQIAQKLGQPASQLRLRYHRPVNPLLSLIFNNNASFLITETAWLTPGSRKAGAAEQKAWSPIVQSLVLGVLRKWVREGMEGTCGCGWRSEEILEVCGHSFMDTLVGQEGDLIFNAEWDRDPVECF